MSGEVGHFRLSDRGTRQVGSAPLYQRLKDALSAQILLGGIRAGDRLPSEREILEQYGVSRVTARRALVELAEEQVIRAMPGRGWFVADAPLSEPPNTLLSFTAMARERGLQPTALVLVRAIRPATLDESEILHVAPGVEIFELERVRLLDLIPVAVDHCIVALNKCPALEHADFATASLYTVLTETANIRPTRAACSLEAVPAGPKLAGLLGIDATAPILVARQITTDQHGEPIESSWVSYRGDRYRFRTTLELSSQ